MSRLAGGEDIFSPPPQSRGRIEGVEKTNDRQNGTM